MFRSFYRQLRKSYFKNLPEIRAVKGKFYPDFVYDRRPSFLENEIPVFTFHSVQIDKFEAQLKFLVKNDYQTLTADEFHSVLIGEKPLTTKSVVLTFDDGMASLWTIVFPLLRKCGFKAVCFLAPCCIEDDNSYYPNLEDVWQRKAKLEQVLPRESGSRPACTWKEIKTMHQEGIIDFQSHTMNHSLIFTSAKIVDFINPSYEFHFFNFAVPVIRINRKDDFSREVELGTPIYSSKPRMSNVRRYFDDEQLRNRCVTYVKESGGRSFLVGQTGEKGLAPW